MVLELQLGLDLREVVWNVRCLVFSWLSLP